MPNQSAFYPACQAKSFRIAKYILQGIVDSEVGFHFTFYSDKFDSVDCAIIIYEVHRWFSEIMLVIYMWVSHSIKWSSLWCLQQWEHIYIHWRWTDVVSFVGPICRYDVSQPTDVCPPSEFCPVTFADVTQTLEIQYTPCSHWPNICTLLETSAHQCGSLFSSV